MEELFKDIPKGYCGVCDICGEYGHTNAHPHLPTTGAWCDKHYEELLSHKIINLSDIVIVVFSVIILGIFISLIIKGF